MPALVAARAAGGGPAAVAADGPIPPTPYHAGAVHFDGSTYLSIDSLTSTDNTNFSFVCWFNFDNLLQPGDNPTIFVSDPNNNYNNIFAGSFNLVMNFGADLGNTDDSLHESTGTLTQGFPVSGWQILMWSMDVSQDGLGKFYIGDVDVTPPFLFWVSTFDIASNGIPFFIGSDLLWNLKGNVADLRIMPGISLLDGDGDIPEATRRLFVDADGKPVDPATATAELGAPCMLFSGDASTFVTNQGTGGVFALTGTLTNASTSPSDDGYHADAVHVDNTTPSSVYLSCPSLTATDNGYFSFVVWVKAATFLPYATLFQVDPLGDFLSAVTGIGVAAEWMGFILRTDTGDLRCYYDVATLTSEWVCLIGSAQTDLSAGTKIMTLYAGDTPVSTITPPGIVDTGPSFNIQFNGESLYLFDDTFNDSFTGDVADFRIMPGISLLTDGDIPEATRRLFIDADGKPVDPATATAALGAPCMLFSGNAAAFGTNQGTGGAFITTGALTNAASSPSD